MPQSARNTIKQSLLFILYIALIATAVLAPEVLMAQESGLVACEGRECQFCHLVATGQNALNWLVLILTIVAGLLFAYAGLTLVTSGGNSAAKEKARTIFNNVIIGYLIVLASWLIIDTLMKVLLDEGKLGRPWSQIECIAQPSAGQVAWGVPRGQQQFSPGSGAPLVFWDPPPDADRFIPPDHDFVRPPPDDPYVPPPPPPEPPPPEPDDDDFIPGYPDHDFVRPEPDPDDDSTQPESEPNGQPPAEGQLSHSEAAALLDEHGIPISSSGNCSNRNVGTCTSLDGVQANSIQRIIELNEATNGGVVVTGGTEVGHSTRGQHTHGSGHKIDIRTTPSVNNYIQNNYEPLGNNQYRDPRGNIYWRHGPVDHWDIKITN